MHEVTSKSMLPTWAELSFPARSVYQDAVMFDAEVPLVEQALTASRPESEKLFHY